MLLTELDEELEGFIPPMDNATTLRHINHLIGNGFVVVARTADGALAGSIGLGVDHWWSNQDYYYLSDFWTFVSKRYRRSQAATQMFREIKKFSDSVEIPIILGIFTRDQQVRKNKLYRRHFDVMGEQFAYGFKGQMSRKRREEAA
jgi:hypothetical protein